MNNKESCTPLEDTLTNEVPITSKEYNDILNIQNTILKMIVSQECSSSILNALCKLAEELLPNSVASVMFLDKNTSLLSVLSAPSVPKAGHDALRNLHPGPHGGSCGNAVFHIQAQYVHDTFTDNRWKNLRQLAYDFNLCSCWSQPIQDKDARAIGTFALSSFEHRSPAPFHKKLLTTAASMVSMVLTNEANEKRVRLFSKALQNANEGIMLTDSKNRIIEVNTAFENIYGIKEKDLLGKNPNVISSGNYDETFYAKMWEELHEHNHWNSEIVNKKADGTSISQWIGITAIYNEHNNTYNYLAIFSDLSELKLARQQLLSNFFHDSLTGLYNKIKLEQLVQSSEQQTLILFNVNNFSYINAAYGFSIGDDLLKKIASIFQKDFGYEYTFRINSDEFAVLFDRVVDVENIVSHIQEYFYRTKLKLEEITLNISFSYGASISDKNLLRNTAIALKKAKNSGKNTLHIFNKDDINNEHRQSFVDSNNLLYNALNEDRVIPYYQGIRDNTTGEISKFEVLARIKNGDEILLPINFIEHAKLSGLSTEITKIIIDKSFKEMSQNNYIFSVNITEDDLTKNYLLAYLEEKCTQYSIVPERIILEVLEGVSISGRVNHIQQLATLKANNYAIAIDDFGSEYSNFERVLDLEIDYLKIDAKYIHDIDTNKKSFEIARAIAYFAKNANIPCIAEFVHKESIQNIILDLEIDFSQGFYFSKPSKRPLILLTP